MPMVLASLLQALLSGNLKLDEDQGKGYTAFVKVPQVKVII